MAEAWIDVSALKPRLASFFGSDRHDLLLFGSTVNQVFEAFVFAQLISWYQRLSNWQVELINSELPALHQLFVRRCQAVRFGKITGLRIRDGAPVFDDTAEVYEDLKLDVDDAPRPELELTDFVVSAETVRFFRRLNALCDGVVEQIEVRAGVPRKMVCKVTFSQNR